ncbi:transglutaminase domain-containing protein [Hymenobacter cellulosilyticus]|uniref:Transglutaminase-like domain-containing protein n=1 Tax=Hymenobacter cellulosilyticus TaxID=2932248 RepID=A0A8T9Q9D3_9BACT|nr:transglutaminase domain-containing protein [Hymenobacter cellulosilyticus]UOQ73011.1 hypothetical protein MUN79_03255 [Hymenobacter cellulosilyticus]
MDAKMQQVPDSSARTVAGLARYITVSFATDADKARAAFVWVATHIRYDVAKRYVVSFQREPAVVVQETMASRKGVCTNYAELYAAIANQAGVKTRVIPGYTKHHDGTVTPVGHMWCATQLAGEWYLMDPTWSAGYVVESTFVPRFTNSYYKVRPVTMIKDHMPFDPLWQLLATPRSPAQFQEGTVPSPAAHPFHVADSVTAYEQQSYIAQLHAANRRVEQHGVQDDHTLSFLGNNRVLEENYYITAYNNAQNAMNAGSNKLNDFVNYFNHQFQPKKTDAELQLLLPPIAADFARSRELLAVVRFQEASRQTSLKQFQQALAENETLLQKSQAFMEHYLRTSKLLRPTLFMNISTIGGRNEMAR